MCIPPEVRLIGRFCLALMLCLPSVATSPVAAQDAKPITATPLPPASDNLPADLSRADKDTLKLALRDGGRLKAGDMDSALVGKWQGSRAWPFAGSDLSLVFLTIGPTGRTLALMVEGSHGQQINIGQITASHGVLRWQSALESEMTMAYVTAGDDLRFIPAFGAPFTLQRDVQGP
jgi:hypothetical protein